MLAIAAGTFIFSTAMTTVQILVFCLVATPYISSLVTFGAIAREMSGREMHPPAIARKRAKLLF